VYKCKISFLALTQHFLTQIYFLCYIL